MTRATPTAALLATLVFLAAPACSRFSRQAPAYRTAKVVRTDVVSAIEATGTLEPEDVVDIGAQVTGQILSFGNGSDGKVLDYGSHVAQGQLLAKIDDAPYALAKAQAEAQLASAESAVRVAEANLARDQATVGQNDAKAEQAQAQLDQARRDYDRARKIGTQSGALTQAAFDAARGAFESAAAVLKAARATADVSRAQAKATEAAVAQAQSAVAQAKVTVALADRNLGYCTIASPIKGIIIDRRVDVGQTVVSNLSASSLFLLAKDLAKMQVWAAVNEADIGGIHAGQPVSFAVDAKPGRTFKGVVDRIRLNAVMTQNVVTYTVEINVDNADGALLPYLTANVKFEASRRDGVLAVPNAALRWKPSEEQIAPGGMPPAGDKEAAREPGKEPGKEPAKGAAGKKRKSSAAMLWVRDAADPAKVRAIPVRAGLSDGVVTEVVLGDGAKVEEGQEIVVGEERKDQGGPSGNNPFANPMFKGGRR